MESLFPCRRGGVTFHTAKGMVGGCAAGWERQGQAHYGMRKGGCNVGYGKQVGTVAGGVGCWPWMFWPHAFIALCGVACD